MAIQSIRCIFGAPGVLDGVGDAYLVLQHAFPLRELLGVRHTDLDLDFQGTSHTPNNRVEPS